MSELQTVTQARVDSWIPVVGSVADLAQMIANTDLVPRPYRDNPAAVAAIILRGREIGLQPMQSLASSYVVNGSVRLYAEAQRALILAAGHQIVFTELTGIKAVVRGRRRMDENWTTVEYTLDMAKTSGAYNRNPNYKTNPRAMLAARASAELARLIFADVIGGFAAVEEPDDITVTVPDDQAGQPARTMLQRSWKPSEAVQPASGRRNLPAGPIMPTEGPEAVSDRPTTSDDQPGPEPDPDQPETGDQDDDDDGQDEPDGWEPDNEPPPTRHGPAVPLTQAQKGMLFRMADQLGYQDRDIRLRAAAAVIARNVESFTELTVAEASDVIDAWRKQINEGRL
jgi:hypothetical protein